VIGNDDPDAPYRVCADCGKRLQELTLRPLEWFNLAAKHGWQKFLLHDDFYNQDGTQESNCAADMRAPTLDEASRSLERLVDYCITRWKLDAAEYDAFRMFAGESILSELSRRAASGNRHVKHVALALCANVLGYIAEPWIRAQYERACEDDMLFSWAEAAAHCLPQPEGVNKTIGALREYSGGYLCRRKAALSWFRSPTVLDWIESHAPCTNVTEDWGQLAALSDLAWNRVELWLSRGPPLSLIALDALTVCIPRTGQAPIVRKLKPRLKECPDRLTVTRALQACMEADAAPRVSNKCLYLTEHIAELL
jgi:hypothetical protein